MKVDAFMRGVRYWEYEKEGATLWAADASKATAHAVTLFKCEAKKWQFYLAIEEVPYAGDHIHNEFFETEEACDAWIAKLARP